MAVYQKVYHKFTMGTQQFAVKLADVYEGNGSNIGTAVGLDRVTTGNELDDDVTEISISDGLKNGKLARLRLSIKNGTTGRVTSARIVCPIDKIARAKGNLLDKTYLNRNITSAGIPRRRRLG
jgi:hypothetical protein